MSSKKSLAEVGEYQSTNVNDGDEPKDSKNEMVQDFRVRYKQPYNASIERNQHQKNLESLSALDFKNIKGDGLNNDTQGFELLESNIVGKKVYLAGGVYLVDEVPSKNEYVNGYFLTKSLDDNSTVKLGVFNNTFISDNKDTGGYEGKYKNPLSNDYQISGRSNLNLFLLAASQNSRSFGPARAVNVGSIYSYASGNTSGNYSSRQCRALSPQSINLGSEDSRVSNGFRGANLVSITSHVTGETGANISSRRSWSTSKHNTNISSVDVIAGGGFGAVLKPSVSSEGSIESIEIVNGGAGYHKEGEVIFYDRLNQPKKIAKARYSVSGQGAIDKITIIDSGSGYSIEKSSDYEVVQANALTEGTYSVNIASANQSITYGQLSFNLGANKSVAKSDISGNIATDKCISAGKNSINIGSRNSITKGDLSFNYASLQCSSKGMHAGCLGAIASEANEVQSLVVSGNNTESSAVGALAIGRRIINNSPRSIAYGDSPSGDKSASNIKLKVSPDGNLDISGTLSQNVAFSDLAKMFENLIPEEIKVGSIVAWEGRKIRLANENDTDFSVHSRTYAILFGDTPFTWADRYKRDEFGEIIKGRVWDEDAGGWDELKNEGVGGFRGAFVDIPLENESFDIKLEQLKRSERRTEWTPVALIGEVHVRVDASVNENSFVRPSSSNGIGTLSVKQTRLKCMELRTQFDKEKGYAVALCLIR
ncbi:peptidase G2 autoproteolytic cleavage domain-containing protein [Type-D symbiont of Plautia stali]|uniref:peptidase G2 autoproteolytic cleavage domain-containing protein n=1 Tax=Type-D symbiont of Plautia stali TaxID=1560356 RepID=UPI001428A0AF|nr:peptidase G2 autoproteolytic cleavage domain-containing protein [Type-D symbiont of Plautia stali]